MNLTTHCGIVIVALVFGSTTGHAGDVKTYRDKGCTFAYPANFKISVKEHGQVIQLVSPNHSAYWEDAITIRKHDRKTEECEPPDGTLPGEQDRRKIAGIRAYGYSGEDAAMDR